MGKTKCQGGFGETLLALQKLVFGDWTVGPDREAGHPNFSSCGPLFKSSPCPFCFVVFSFSFFSSLLTGLRFVSCAL